MCTYTTTTSGMGLFTRWYTKVRRSIHLNLMWNTFSDSFTLFLLLFVGFIYSCCAQLDLRGSVIQEGLVFVFNVKYITCKVIHYSPRFPLLLSYDDFLICTLDYDRPRLYIYLYTIWSSFIHHTATYSFQLLIYDVGDLDCSSGWLQRAFGGWRGGWW